MENKVEIKFSEKSHNVEITIDSWQSAMAATPPTPPFVDDLVRDIEILRV